MMTNLLKLSALCISLAAGAIHLSAETLVDADLLIVGGTESGCAAAAQAARMGVERIVVVNDVEWLGGQFSAEALGAVDENRAKGYNGKVPIPRSGLFLEVIEAIEDENARLYGGVRHPGNTRVITTVRPVVAEKIFRRLLAPYEETGRISRFSNFVPESVQVQEERVRGVTFTSKTSEKLKVRAKLTIDASDWGEVVRLSGAAWEAGQDPRSRYGEPSAHEDGRPSTDLNPITWCMILEQKKEETLFPEPAGYDPRYFTGRWGWIDETFAYTSRRLVDGEGFREIDHLDVLLVNTPPIDYPLDVYPAEVARKLEATELGASKKNLVAMTRAQREIVFEDARQHTLKFYHHLQRLFPKFRKMALSEEFGTKDKLPPKPYVRESLRLKAKYMLKEQDVLGFGSRSNYAAAMFPDAVFSWQFELDFHPTQRSWITPEKADGPWEAVFRGNRRFHRGGTGRAVFPIRSFVPERVQGLLGAQKNLGYSSIVSSSCRLHDQSIHAGQACGAVAAVSLRRGKDPGKFYKQPAMLAEIWDGLLNPKGGVPLVIWPFGDLGPKDQGFYAVQQLALRRLLGLTQSETTFRPDAPATEGWVRKLRKAWKEAGTAFPKDLVHAGKTRREVAVRLWEVAGAHKPAADKPGNADGDALGDPEDPLPFTPGRASWVTDPSVDGIPDAAVPFVEGTRSFNFGPKAGSAVEGYAKDFGKVYSKQAGFGWRRDLSANVRLRMDSDNLRRGFVFTRKQDLWECDTRNGKWRVRLCLGDSEHEQPGQVVQIENTSLVVKVDTASGQFKEVDVVAEVKDGKLTLTLGKPAAGANTCLNWLILTPVVE
jgi:hypothetical protein